MNTVEDLTFNNDCIAQLFAKEYKYEMQTIKKFINSLEQPKLNLILEGIISLTNDPTHWTHCQLSQTFIHKVTRHTFSVPSQIKIIIFKLQGKMIELIRRNN